MPNDNRCMTEEFFDYLIRTKPCIKMSDSNGTRMISSEDMRWKLESFFLGALDQTTGYDVDVLYDEPDL